MLELRPMDTTVPIFRQLGTAQSPVVLVNVFRVAAEEAAGLLRAWIEDAEWMKRQPGFISTQLHEGIGGSTTFLNYAVWESTEHFRRAFEHPEFKRSLEKYPASTVASPHLFKRLSVPNLCVAG